MIFFVKEVIFRKMWKNLDTKTLSRQIGKHMGLETFASFQ